MCVTICAKINFLFLSYYKKSFFTDKYSNFSTTLRHQNYARCVHFGQITNIEILERKSQYFTRISIFQKKENLGCLT